MAAIRLQFVDLLLCKIKSPHSVVSIFVISSIYSMGSLSDYHCGVVLSICDNYIFSILRVRWTVNGVFFS